MLKLPKKFAKWIPTFSSPLWPVEFQGPEEDKSILDEIEHGCVQKDKVFLNLGIYNEVPLSFDMQLIMSLTIIEVHWGIKTTGSKL